MNFDLGPDLREHRKEGEHEDYAVLRHVLSLFSVDDVAVGYALEFGVATGTTLAMIAKHLPVIGFDSFEGLPEDWRDDFKAGAFKGVRPSGPIPNATIVEGQFIDTVPEYQWPSPILLVHIDCDLYSSTKTALDALAHSGVGLGGTYFVFDEFFGYDGAEQHEQRAFSEFIADTGYEYEVIGHGREQWAVKIV